VRRGWLNGAQDPGTAHRGVIRVGAGEQDHGAGRCVIGHRRAPPGRLRASRADREQVVEVLKAAFVEERLGRDEFELRVGRALGSRTYADLAALTVDLPAGLTRARPRRPARKPAVPKSVAAVACASAVFAVGLGAPSMGDGGVVVGLVIGGAAGCVAAVLLTMLLLFHAWLEKHAGSQAPQGLPPGTGGETSHGVTPADPAGQLQQTNRHPRHIAEAAGSRLTRRPLPGARPSRRPRSLVHGYAVGCPGH
jgi:Domain of unknown function (DUF1707)